MIDFDAFVIERELWVNNIIFSKSYPRLQIKRRSPYYVEVAKLLKYFFADGTTLLYVQQISQLNPAVVPTVHESCVER